jgi:DNA mismatch repair ATPase MutS
MTEFYEFYDNADYHDALVYSFGFHGYTDVLNGISANIRNDHIHFCKFKNNSLKLKKKEEKKEKGEKGEKGEKREKGSSCSTSFKDAYYPALIGQTPVKNTYDLSRNIVITGPNAAGKTTILKSSLINVITSQQFGCGCYSSAVIKPYSRIHCYLNIPDTIGRDSLLQAEARRCKDIIDEINSTKDEDTHLCIFDEIYSGTNPEEAISSANAVMNYLANKPNVTTILTTHYIDLCKKLECNKNIINCCMKIKLLDNTKLSSLKEETMRRDFEYTYLLIKGISEVKGGIKVLIDMKYPEEILANA